MKTGGTVQLTVEHHRGFDPDRPEGFDWSHVINPKVQGIALDLATEIVIRRERCARDPFIPGLQEALRVIAKTAVWATMVASKAELIHRGEVTVS